MSDTEYEIEDGETKKSIVKSTLGFLESVPWLLILVIVVVFLVITSDVFISDVIGSFDKAEVAGVPNTKGTLIQAGILAIVTMLFGTIACRGY